MNNKSNFQKKRKAYRALKSKMAKLKIGLPQKVEFYYHQGIVECYPKEKKWIIHPRGDIPIVHFTTGRNDVTKYKAKRLLKLALLKVLRDDTGLLK